MRLLFQLLALVLFSSGTSGSSARTQYISKLEIRIINVGQGDLIFESDWSLIHKR